MRFSSEYMPPSEYVITPEDTAQVARDLERWNKPYGIDTEGDGLGYKTVVTGKDGKTSIKQAGDGLGARLDVICLCFNNRRIAVGCGPGFEDNFVRMIDPLLKTQHHMLHYNMIFDLNCMEYNAKRLTGKWVEFTTAHTDSMRLWNHWDEDGEESAGEKGLKARSERWLGVKMSKFAKIFDRDIWDHLQDPSKFDRALDYCTRDAFSHLALAQLGHEVAATLPWCMSCPECGRACPQNSVDGSLWYCTEHGWVHGYQDLSILDWHYRLDVPFLFTLKRMEQRGVGVTLSHILPHLEAIDRYLQSLHEQFNREVGQALVQRGGLPWDVDPNSAQQLTKLYYSDTDASGMVTGLGLNPLNRTKTGAGSSGSDDLEKLASVYDAPGIHTLLTMRKIGKIVSTYVRGFDALIWKDDQRLHTWMRPDAVSGRLKSRAPNLQNAPRDPLIISLPPVNPLFQIQSDEEVADSLGMSMDDVLEMKQSPEFNPTDLVVDVRANFVADPGHILGAADYSQLEVRLAAVVSNDQALIDIINSGKDMHCYTAGIVFGDIPHTSYDNFNECQQNKDGNHIPRFRRAILASYEGESALIDHLSLQAVPVPGVFNVTQSRDELLALLEKIRVHVDKLGLEGKAYEELTDDNVQAVMEACDPELVSKILSLLGIRDSFLKQGRNAVKAVFFGLLYGAGAGGLAAGLSGILGRQVPREEAQRIIDMILIDAFPGLGRMQRSLAKAVIEYGYVRTYAGRYRHPKGAWSAHGGTRARVRRQVANSPIQGFAADVMQFVMIAIDSDEEFRSLGGKMLMQVHDELLMQAPLDTAQAALERMVYIMENLHGMDLPLKLEAVGHLGHTWGEAK